MNNFGLIMENWRGYLQEEKIEELAIGSKAKMKKAMGELPAEEQPVRSKIETVGQLRKALGMIRKLHLGGEAKKHAKEWLAIAFPGGGAAYKLFSDVKDAAELYKNLYTAKDSFKTNTGLDKLNIDDEVSAIVDDPIEFSFLTYIEKLFANAPDDEPLESFDINKELEKYIASKFDGTTVKK